MILPDLPALLAGKQQPRDADERLCLLAACQAGGRPRTAARLYADAFAADPELADDPKAAHRYHAACSAALAAAGKGDATKLDGKERARLRRQALDWLRAELTSRAKRLESGQPADRAEAAKRVANWQMDGDLVGIRDRAELDKLPQEERKAFARLWADVAALWNKAVGKK